MQAKSKVSRPQTAKKNSSAAKPVTAKVKKAVTPKPGKAAATAKPAKQKSAVAEAARVEASSADSTNTEVAKVRVKLVRDSFTMPREDFDLIAQLKARALDFKRPTKKSELLRAGLQVLAALPDVQLHGVLETLRPLKAGRPKNKR